MTDPLTRLRGGGTVNAFLARAAYGFAYDLWIAQQHREFVAWCAQQRRESRERIEQMCREARARTFPVRVYFAPVDKPFPASGGWMFLGTIDGRPTYHRLDQDVTPP